MSESPPSVARVTGVTHRYGDTTALDAVTLDIPGGRMVPLGQIATLSYQLEPPMIWRRQRLPTSKDIIA